MKAMPKTAPSLNGVDVTKLNETIAAIKETPAMARFRFINNNQWLTGGHNRSTINEYYGALADQRREQPFVMDNDEPPILLGRDLAANPVEYVLHALAGCITTAMVFHAAARGIEIKELETSFEGDINVLGFLGLRDDVRPGYQSIRVTVRIKGDMTDEQLKEIGTFGPRFSPVFDTLSKGTQISLTAVRK